MLAQKCHEVTHKVELADFSKQLDLVPSFASGEKSRRRVDGAAVSPQAPPLRRPRTSSAQATAHSTEPQAQLLQLPGIDGAGRAGHQVGARSGLGKGDQFANRTLAGQQCDDAIEA